MAVRTRKSVWALGPGNPELQWYSRAVEALQAKPRSDPTSWAYMAFVHGFPPNVQPLPGTQGFWAECQHQSWFFLSWHRGYLAAFEAVVARTIVELGGPAEWALPYWDYSEPLAQNPNARLLPVEFRDRTLPGGARNPLWAPRRNVQNGDFGLTSGIVDITAALGESRFTRSGFANPGFGGPRTGWSHAGNVSGLLENVPHNVLHGAIGGGTGWMGNPDTAGFDPIFWLHHCNIDRLWEVWRLQWPNSAPPAANAWRTGVSFGMHDGAGQPFTFNSAQMIDTTQVLHGYVYDGIAPIATADADVLDDSGPPSDAGGMTELIGASHSGVDLGAGKARVAIAMQPGLGTELLDDSGASEGRLWLKLENVTGVGTPGNYRVLADLPGDGEEPVEIGVLSTFGIERASTPSAFHGGSGMTAAFEVTAIAGTLGLTDKTVDRLEILIEPMTYEGAADDDLAALPDDFPAALADAIPPAAAVSKARIGRLSLYRD